MLIKLSRILSLPIQLFTKMIFLSTNSNFNSLLQNILIYLNECFYLIMDNSSKIKAHQIKLLKQYNELIEDAYNIRQTDSALSDILEFRALKLLNKLNRLKFLSRDIPKTVS